MTDPTLKMSYDELGQDVLKSQSDEGIKMMQGFMRDLIDGKLTGAQAVELAPDFMPACQVEDETNCYWNAKTMGNGIGQSFVNVGNTVFYENGTTKDFSDPEE